jgi:hypothetical protein
MQSVGPKNLLLMVVPFVKKAESRFLAALGMTGMGMRVRHHDKVYLLRTVILRPVLGRRICFSKPTLAQVSPRGIH